MMTFAIICLAILFAFIALAPEALTQIALLGAWLIGALFVIIPILKILGGFL